MANIGERLQPTEVKLTIKNKTVNRGHKKIWKQFRMFIHYRTTEQINFADCGKLSVTPIIRLKKIYPVYHYVVQLKTYIFNSAFSDISVQTKIPPVSEWELLRVKINEHQTWQQQPPVKIGGLSCKILQDSCKNLARLRIILQDLARFLQDLAR